MTISAGSNLGPYKIVAPLGAGGMGEVWRAKDTRLDRDVAIKILPAGFAENEQFLQRFEREARAISKLSHAHVCTLFDVGKDESEGLHYLVMEYLEGESLADRLRKGPLPLHEVLRFGREIASALDAAHRQGITHRDLKPGNVVLTKSGAKLLDFGLAKTASESGAPIDGLTNLPTEARPLTQEGTILGTFQYMAPEQLEGQEADARTDIFALGAVLFEMATGRRAFIGESKTSLIAAIVSSQPAPISTVVSMTPPALDHVVRRCLEKDPDDRWQSAHDVASQLQWISEAGSQAGVSAPVTVRRRTRERLAWGLAIVLGAALLGTTWLLTGKGSETARRPTHLSLSLPDGLQVASRDKLPLGAPQPSLAISDDGRLVLVTVERDGTTFIYRRFLDEPSGEILEDSRNGHHPRISPDGKWISFMAGNTLMRMAATGDRATRVLELPNSFGHDWIDERTIVINRTEATELLKVDTERGAVEEFERRNLEVYFWPSRVPNENAILINSRSHVAKSEEGDIDQISMVDLETGALTGLGAAGSQPQLLPDGTLLVVRDGMLAATRLDLDTLQIEPRYVTALDGLLVEGWIGQYAVSKDGTLVYVPGEWRFGTELVWDDGDGHVEPLGFPLLPHGDFDLSPDGRKLAVTVGGGRDMRVWIFDLERGTRRLLTTNSAGYGAIWSPDAEQLVYTEVRDNIQAIHLQTEGSDAPPTLLVEAETSWLSAYAWHENVGIIYNLRGDIYRLDPQNPEDSEPLVTGAASEWGPDLSPDGRWMAYTSDESGRYEIYMRAVAGDRSWPVSLEGGEEPLFSPDGKKLYFRNGNRFYAAPILEASEDGKRFRAGKPGVVVEGAYSNVPGLSYDVGPDERLLLLRTDGGTERPSHLNVILNWDVELARRLTELR